MCNDEVASSGPFSSSSSFSSQTLNIHKTLNIRIEKKKRDLFAFFFEILKILSEKRLSATTLYTDTQ